MYLSGTLKTRTVNFYKEQMTYFSGDHFNFGNYMLANNGSLSKLPSKDGNLEEILAHRQEELIASGIKKTKSLAKEMNVYSPLLQKELDALFRASRKFAFALFECLYKIILNSKSKSDLQKRLKEFQKFRQYVDSDSISLRQVELDIMIELFLAGVDYLPIDVAQRKAEIFKINLDGASPNMQQIISLGEFISPGRVPVFVKSLQKNENLYKYVAPIYFAIKSDVVAANFFKACTKDATLCDDAIEIYNQAQALEVPDNLGKMILERRKLY